MKGWQGMPKGTDRQKTTLCPSERGRREHCCMLTSVLWQVLVVPLVNVNLSLVLGCGRVSLESGREEDHLCSH